MADYSIRPLQLKVLDILLAVDKICKEHHLHYYLWAGTMLGAVRHQGFIPWDDDLDICMPRKDYDLLINHSAEWLPSPYEMVSTELDNSYPLPFAKIQDASTTLIERFHLSYLGGIYLDVFPIDGIPSNKLKQRIHFFQYQFYKKVLYFIFRDPYKHGHGVSCWIPLLCRKFFTTKGVQQKLHHLMTQYDFERCDYIVDHDDGLKGVLKKEILGNPTPVLFEEKEVLGVEKFDTYLKQKYGDYLKIPAHGKQRQHNFHYLSLEEPYRTYHTVNN